MQTPYTAQKHHILLVDDERMVLNVLAEQLLDEGFAVTTTAHFFDALFLLESQHFDVLICDVGLQGQSGFDVLAAAQKVQSHIEAVMITGFPRESDRERAAALDARYLQKPIKLDQLLETLRSFSLRAAA